MSNNVDEGAKVDPERAVEMMEDYARQARNIVEALGKHFGDDPNRNRAAMRGFITLQLASMILAAVTDMPEETMDRCTDVAFAIFKRIQVVVGPIPEGSDGVFRVRSTPENPQ